jgi:hypothetical protein
MASIGRLLCGTVGVILVTAGAANVNAQGRTERYLCKDPRAPERPVWIEASSPREARDKSRFLGGYYVCTLAPGFEGQRPAEEERPNTPGSAAPSAWAQDYCRNSVQGPNMSRYSPQVLREAESNCLKRAVNPTEGQICDREAFERGFRGLERESYTAKCVNAVVAARHKVDSREARKFESAGLPAGTTQQKIDVCNEKAVGKAGDERKDFMRACLAQ